MKRHLDNASKWDIHARRFIYRIWSTKALLIREMPSYNVIVDLGCGDGIYLPLLLGRCDYLIGADISGLRLMRAKELISSLGIKNSIDLVMCDARYLPFRSGSVGLIYMSEVLEHFSNQDFEVVLGEIERVSLALLATIPNPHAPLFKTDPTHILKYTVMGLIKYLNKRSVESNYRYSLRGLHIPIVREKGQNNQAIRRLTKKILEMLPWISTTLIIEGYRKDRKA